MAGSLSHITGRDGSFTMDAIDSLGDAAEALEECHQIIAFLLPYAGREFDNCDATGMLAEACHQMGYPLGHTPILESRN